MQNSTYNIVQYNTIQKRGKARHTIVLNTRFEFANPTQYIGYQPGLICRIKMGCNEPGLMPPILPKTRISRSTRFDPMYKLGSRWGCECWAN